MALVHHPVTDKNGEVIASAVTNLDLHDISRVARTYGAKGFYVVTPLEDQKELVRRIVAHWIDGYGGQYNPKRREALELIRIQDTLDAAIDDIGRHEGLRPVTVATTAREHPRGLTFGEMQGKMRGHEPYLLVLGTAWGLTAEVVETMDVVLEPIRGNDGYNHLPVRAAAAIILDRLTGENDRG